MIVLFELETSRVMIHITTILNSIWCQEKYAPIHSISNSVCQKYQEVLLYYNHSHFGVCKISGLCDAESIVQGK